MEENIAIKQKQLETWRKRPHSWSQHSQFRDYSKEDWYKRYVLGERLATTKEIDFGSAVDKRIQADPNYIPSIPRGTSLQHTITLEFGEHKLTGLFDIYDENEVFIGEIKTGKAAWDKDRVDNHGQITMYCFLLFLNNNIMPESVKLKLYWIPTEERADFSIGFAKPFKVHEFETKRTLKDCLEFGAEVVNIRKEMEKYILTHDHAKDENGNTVIFEVESYPQN